MDCLAHLPDILTSHGAFSLNKTAVRDYCISVGIRNFRQNPLTLLELVDMTRQKKAKEPKDLIFALLGMVESDLAQLKFSCRGVHISCLLLP